MNQDGQPSSENQLATRLDTLKSIQSIVKDTIKSTPPVDIYFLSFVITVLIGLFIIIVMKYTIKDNYDKKQKSEIKQKFIYLFFILIFISTIILVLFYKYTYNRDISFSDFI